ncbi:phosphonatase-like hydrolase [Echinicola sediminis]
MKKIALAVFDMAGTTVDEGNIVYKTVQKVINDEGFSLSLEEVLLHGAGKEKHQAIVDVLTACTEEKDVVAVADKAFSNFKPALEQAYDEMEVNTFQGVKEMMEFLRENNVSVVLNTGYDRKTASGLLRKLNWEEGRDIDGLITADDVVNGRPAPDMIRAAMEKCSVEDSEAVLKAGDSAIDIEEGKNAKCGLTVGVLTGAQTREQLEKAAPDYILDSLAELGGMLIK